jgi:hypothetical protein
LQLQEVPQIVGLGFDTPVLFGGIVVSGQGSLPFAMAKLMTEFLILSRFVLVVDNLVLAMEDRQNVTPAPSINPIITRTTEISTSEKPFGEFATNLSFKSSAERICSFFSVPGIDGPLRQ